MSLLVDIGNFLEGLGLGTQASGSPTIILGGIPAEPDNLIVLTALPGRTPVRTMGPQGSQIVIERPALKAYVRDIDYNLGETKIYNVWQALDWYTGTINGTYYHLIEARDSPSPIGEDEDRRHQFTVNFEIMRDSS